MKRLISFHCRLWRHNRAAVAVEFAIVGPIFLLLLMGIIETALVFAASVVVEGAVTDAARVVRTGQAQQSADPITTFRTQLCNSLVVLVSCGDLTFDVRTFPDFSSISLAVEVNEDGDPVDEDGNVIVETFTPGGAGDIVMVRILYVWTFFTPFVGELYHTGAGNNVLLVSTTVFRAEPYEGLGGS